MTILNVMRKKSMPPCDEKYVFDDDLQSTGDGAIVGQDPDNIPLYRHSFLRVDSDLIRDRTRDRLTVRPTRLRSVNRWYTQ